MLLVWVLFHLGFLLVCLADCVRRFLFVVGVCGLGLGLGFWFWFLETNQVIGEKKPDLSSSKSKQYRRNLGPAMIISAQINGLWDRLAPAHITTQGPRFRQPLNILMQYFQCLLIFSIKQPTAEVLLPFQCQ